MSRDRKDDYARGDQRGKQGKGRLAGSRASACKCRRDANRHRREHYQPQTTKLLGRLLAPLADPNSQASVEPHRHRAGHSSEHERKHARTNPPQGEGAYPDEDRESHKPSERPTTHAKEAIGSERRPLEVSLVASLNPARDNSHSPSPWTFTLRIPYRGRQRRCGRPHARSLSRSSRMNSSYASTLIQPASET